MRTPFSVLLITDWTVSDFEAKLQDALSVGGAIAVQHRFPQATGKVFYQTATRTHRLCSKHQVPLFINRRIDVALALEAHLHLPSDAAAPSQARRLMPFASTISVAVHSLAEATKAAEADYALLSPVFRPRSKPEDARATLGVNGFMQLAHAVSCRSVALGGISQENIHLLPPQTPVAVIGAVWNAPDVATAVSQLLQRSP
jgi:thiamine-phosphate pyrophosphorylase